MPRIVVERGSEKGVSLNLDAPDASAIVGRLKSCNLVLTDGLASRTHFKIERCGETFILTDLNSHNGTHVNGIKVEGEVELPLGATIRVGETLIGFRADNRDEEGMLAGKRLGGYHLVTRLGTGGMGEVYKAMQIALGRVVALKILNADLTKDRSFVEKFLREARAAGKFNHPNVIHVHEAGEDQGTYFYSMEFLDGGSVQDQVAKGGKLSPRRATEIVLQAARALEYAEKVGIVHCDIKPDNLMLTPGGDVRLADLGIAKTLNDKGKAEQSDGVFGSPHYMSPEQARGLSLDHRSDIYSLGVTYYRLVLGKVPFSGKDAREIMEKQVYDEPMPPRRIDSTLPPALYNVLGRMLKKRAADRYSSASSLIKDLESVLTQLDHTDGPRSPVPSSKISRITRLRKPPGSFWSLLL